MSIDIVSGKTFLSEQQDNGAGVHANQDDVDAFDAAFNKAESIEENGQLTQAETSQLLVDGMIKMSLSGVAELFRKQMLGNPADKL
ncbi:hypothetical protein SG34_032750 [Thalassomonas viridans]|uniref:Uncharacterized protein n=1 Tax=Thalassomonas viridans TaxID=137584 RepID=A0AAF0CAL4_9GAMM|nr:hypothetical protein [Thalassomonas viridans]WDE08682.1 hypothetical protein SG34_032750 [Thalassomonas viridans]